MASLSVAPSALAETPDETIRRLTAELHEALDQQTAAARRTSGGCRRAAAHKRRTDGRLHPPPRWGRAGVGVRRGTEPW